MAVAAVVFFASGSWVGMGNFVQVSLSDSSRLERVFSFFLEVSSSSCFFLRGRGFSPTLPRQL